MSPWYTFEGKFNAMMHKSNNNGIQSLQLGYIRDREQHFTPRVTAEEFNGEESEQEDEMIIPDDKVIKLITVGLATDLHNNE